MNDLTLLAISELAPLLRTREISPVELTEAYLARIEWFDPQVNAYTTVTADRARDDARRAETEIGAGHYRGPLHGVPIALKDLYATAGIRTTGGSKVLEDWVPDADSTPARLLREAGTVLLGKLNTHEFAAGYTTNNHWYGPTRNPWDLERIPGGSSGGSGAAIAARLAAGTLGTDTGGSIRVPAAFCGCVGFKPTYGRTSKAGVIPLSFMFDHTGPIARTVADAATILTAISGYDPADANTVPIPVEEYSSSLDGDLRGLRVGIPPFAMDGLDDAVRTAFAGATEQVRALGADLRDVELPQIPEMQRAWGTIFRAEVVQYHGETLAARPDAYSPEVAAMISAPMPSGERIAASFRALYAFREALRGLLEEVDLFLLPATLMLPPRIGEDTFEVAGRQLQTNDIGRFMLPFNASHLPALVQPCGFSANGLPIALQWAGRPFDEATVLRAAHAYERATDWLRWPAAFA